MKQITIIIPNYNGIKFIKECLDSLLQQEPGTPDFHILIVDNGSADGSLELIKESFPQIRVIALPSNTGFCHAVNVGIEATKSPYLILLNNDTKVMPSFVRNLYNAIENRPDAFSVSAKMLMWDNAELIDDAGDQYCALGWAYARGKGKPAKAYDRFAEVFSSCGGAAIYRRKILDKIGLFDEAHFAYLEDLDIGYRARLYGYKNYYEPSAEVIHYGSASSGSRYNNWKTSMSSANSVYVIAKNMPLLQWICNLPFFILGFLIKFIFFCKKGMGIQYLKGLWKGLKKSHSDSGKKRKIPFQWSRLRYYLAVQGQLYINILRILKKT